MKKELIRLIPVVSIALFLASCNEGEEGSEGPGGGATEERLATFFLNTESVASNTYSVMDMARRDSVVEAGDTSVINGAITYKSGNTIVLDFGSGIQGADGVTRSGQINISENGDYFSNGGNLTASFNNYVVDGETINGDISVTNQGSDQIDIVISNFSFGGEFDYNAAKSVKWLSGFSTRTVDNDDKFEVNGTSNGTEVSSSNNVNATFLEDLVIDRSCTHSVVEGVIDLSLSGDSTITYNSATLDFIKSDGCNNHVTITINGDNGRSITLPKTFSGF